MCSVMSVLTNPVLLFTFETGSKLVSLVNGVTPVKIEGIPLIHVCSLFFFLGSIFYLEIVR